MYKKILVPLDLSEASERVLDRIQGEFASDGKLTLLHVIPPGKSVVVEGQILAEGVQVEESARSEANNKLLGIISRRALDPDRCRSHVAVSASVASGIVNFAESEGVDLIAMYTHDRKGLAKILKGSVSNTVQKKVSVDMMVFTLRELQAAV